MITLKNLLEVCSPDRIEVCGKTIAITKDGVPIPDGLLAFPVKNIQGWDDGLTVELDAAVPPCVNLLVRKDRTS